MRSVRTFVPVLLLAASSVSGAGFRVVDTTIDAAPNQEIQILGTGTDSVEAMNLYVLISGAPLVVTDISIVGSIWEHNNLGPAVFLEPEYSAAVLYIITATGRVNTPGLVATLIVDATGLEGQTVTIGDYPDPPSDFALDGSDGFEAGTITIRAGEPPPNQPPVVNAGSDQQVSAGALVQLNGSASDPENDPLTFFWMQVAGPEVMLSSRFVANPTFTAPNVPVVTLFEFQCRVSDGNSTRTDTVVITVQPADDGGNGDPQDPPPPPPPDNDDGGVNPPDGGSDDGDQDPSDPPPPGGSEDTPPPSTDDPDQGNHPPPPQDQPSDGSETGNQNGGYTAPACGLGFADTAMLGCAGFWLMLLPTLRRSES